MIRFAPAVLLFSLAISCKPNVPAKVKPPTLRLSYEQANKFAELPLKCIQQEYPNKLGQVVNDSEELLRPSILHPAFYGCFDWHSAVHGHWLLVRLLKMYPKLKQSNQIKELLTSQLTSDNIQTEIRYFNYRYNETFERTYGWAWLLKLQQELDAWQNEEAQDWARQLRPLSQLILEKYKTFLPKLMYPIRSGEHSNSAFGMAYAYDYALSVGDEELLSLIRTKSRQFFMNDRNYPFHLEPSGFDFLSPCLQESDLMRRVLSKKEFLDWFGRFAPDMMHPEFTLKPGKVGDRSDGKLVHLDGLNFSRAWCFYALAKEFPELKHLRALGDLHVAYSLPSIIDGDYMGEHWLATFAVMALLHQ